MVQRVIERKKHGGPFPWRLLATVPLLALGVVFLLSLLLAFTPVPWWAYRWLATDTASLGGPPQYIVVLGGGGIPSESGLMRTYWGAEAARTYGYATVVVALPVDGELDGSATGRMRDEMILRGVERARILIEPQGRNTREQAINVGGMIGPDHRKASVLIVTSPDHMKRALLTFRKAGFGNVAPLAAFSESVQSSLAYDTRELGGRSLPVSNIGSMTSLKYRFWNHLGYEVRVMRELTALGYYKLMGWI